MRLIKGDIWVGLAWSVVVGLTVRVGKKEVMMVMWKSFFVCAFGCGQWTAAVLVSHNPAMGGVHVSKGGACFCCCWPATPR